MSNTETQVPQESKFDIAAAKMSKVGAKIGNQRHMASIRDAFATFMPLIIVGSLAIMINSVFVSQNGLLAYMFNVTEALNPEAYATWSTFAFYISPIFVGAADATMSFFAVYMAFLFGYFLAGTYGDKQVFGGLVGLAAFIALQPFAAGVASVVDPDDLINGIYTGIGSQISFLSTNGLLMAMFAGLTAPMMYHHLAQSPKLKVTMPDGVPPAVSSSFTNLFPIVITIFAFALIQPVWGGIIHLAIGDYVTMELGDSGEATTLNIYYLFNAINTFLFAPMKNLSTSFPAVLLVTFIVNVFWFFGLHGTNIMGPFISTFWTTATIENVDLFAKYGNEVFTNPEYFDQLNVWTDAAFNAFVFAGGVGATLSLILVINIFSKDQSAKQISRIGTPAGIFQINEPIIFGLPIMLNPVYLIPFLIVGPLLAGTTYIAIAAGMVNPAVVLVPWTTPIFLSGILTTMDPWSLVLTTMTLGMAFVLYLPFAMLDSTRQIKELSSKAGLTPNEFIVTSNKEAKHKKYDKKINSPFTQIEFKESREQEKLDKILITKLELETSISSYGKTDRKDKKLSSLNSKIQDKENIINGFENQKNNEATIKSKTISENIYKKDMKKVLKEIEKIKIKIPKTKDKYSNESDEVKKIKINDKINNLKYYLSSLKDEIKDLKKK